VVTDLVGDDPPALRRQFDDLDAGAGAVGTPPAAPAGSSSIGPPHPNEGDKLLFIFDGSEATPSDDEIEEIRFSADSELPGALPPRMLTRVTNALRRNGKRRAPGARDRSHWTPHRPYPVGHIRLTPDDPALLPKWYWCGRSKDHPSADGEMWCTANRT
jgi:hypothetical protein